jgi:hypothetical protein
MMRADLTGKRALVTGGASGIGLAAVEALLACGATVAVNYLPADPRGPDVVQTLGREAGGYRVTGAPGDVSDAGEAERLVGIAIADLGGLDILINNAGMAGTVEPIPFENLEAMTEEFWSKILGTNLVGPFRCAKAAAPALKGGTRRHRQHRVDRRARAGRLVDRLLGEQSRAHQPDAQSRQGAGAGGQGQRGGARSDADAVDRSVAGRAQGKVDRQHGAEAVGRARRRRAGDGVSRRPSRDYRADAGGRLRARPVRGAGQSPRTTPVPDLRWYHCAAPSWNGRNVLRVKLPGTVSAAAECAAISSS